jgi:CBS domain-containing protein
MTKCSEVMTRHVVCALPDDSVSEVAQLMKREDIGPIPIVEDENTKKLVGIVTDRDLALKVVAEERDPKHTKVKEVMTRKVVTCKADDDIKKAIDAMEKNQLRRILVVENGDRVVGIIAQADVATRLDESKKTAEMVKEVSR